MTPLADPPHLEQQLAGCVLRVAAGGTVGTGFLVGPGLLLTCRHVVAPALDRGAPVQVTDRAGTAYPATVREGRGPGWPDLALLAVPDAAVLPAVVLDATPTPRGSAQELLVGGYPARSTEVPYQTRAFSSGGEQNYAPAGSAGAYLRLDGDPVVGGMSGGPVFNLTTGFVCGIVRLTIDDRIDAGGFAVPMATVLQQLPALKPLHDRPGRAAQPWLDLLGPVHLKEHRRYADGARMDAEVAPAPRVDLRVVAGSPLDGWTVSVAEPANTATVTVGDLGGGVMEALDRWSRRRPLESRAETELLGTLLYRALLPAAVAASLPTGGPRTLVRLRVDPDDRLAAIPWEYARSAAGKPLATDPALAFSRFVEVDGAPVVPKDTMRVLGVTVCPPAVADRMPARLSRGGSARLVGGSQLGDDLRRSVQGRSGRAPVEATVRSDISLDEFDQLLRDEGPWDVVHYVGLGWEFDDDECTLAFADGPEVLPAPLSSVLDKLVEHRCPLVVVQLLNTPMDRPGPALGAMRLLPLLEGGVQAVVVAQHAATNQHVTGFDGRFYEELAAGEPVEVATQKARRSLLESPPQLDYTAFGTITVTTTRDGDLRLVTPARATGRGGAGTPAAPQPYGGPR